MTDDAVLVAGEPVWYHQTQRGGYGYEYDVPAVFVRYTSSRWATIDVALLAGGFKRITVQWINLRRRPTP